MFIIMSVHKEIGISVNNCYPELKQDIKLSWANGMIGACPVFDTREEAENYLDGAEDVQILEINTIDE